jgi:hypothetical protein
MALKVMSLSSLSEFEEQFESCSDKSRGDDPVTSLPVNNGNLLGVGETGDCAGDIERALVVCGVKKRASGDEVGGEDSNRLLK